MAISIDTVYQKVLAMANKEQRGYITPQEFNLLANQAQMSIFESYFYDKNMRERLEPIKEDHTTESDIVELIAKKLKPFTSIATVMDGNTFDTNYQTGKIFHNNRVCRKVDLNEIQRMSSSQRHTGGEDPVYAESNVNGKDILVYTPSSLATTGVTCEIISKPSTPKWTYTIVNEQALYNASASDLSDFELHTSEENNLVLRILELAGIVLNKGGLVQLAAQKNTENKQLQTQ